MITHRGGGEVLNICMNKRYFSPPGYTNVAAMPEEYKESYHLNVRFRICKGTKSTHII